jgi:hypothetical protein
MGSPLYKHAERLFKQQARANFRKTEFGKLVGELSGIRRGAASATKVRSIQRRMKRMHKLGLGQVVRNTDAGRLAAEVARYSKGGAKTAVLDYVFESLGPLGGLLRGLLRPGGRSTTSNVQDELDAAQNLLQAFGYNVQAPGAGQKARRKPGRKDRAQTFLENLGFTVIPPEEEKRGKKPREKAEEPIFEPPRGSKPDKEPRQMPSGRIEVQIGGRKRRYDQNDPVLTGEMLRVESSNVWAIGFIFNHANPMKGDLRVQYGQKRGKGALRAGPIYEYHGIHPDVFAAFQKARSKGEFVWDRLRIRGTVSGHTVQYDLVGIADGYVPRKATRYGPNEYFIQRSVSVGGRQIESQLEDRFAGRARPQRPNMGLPSRGQPNRGAPNRG